MCKETAKKEEALPVTRLLIEVFDFEVCLTVDGVFLNKAEDCSTELRSRAEINKSQVVKLSVQGTFGNTGNK
jgi:hypothetical protein